jgi:hypothetical protein
LNEGHRLEVFLGIENNLPTAQTDNGRRPASECVEVEEIGVVESADPGLAEPAVYGHRHSAHVDLLADLTAKPATDDDAVNAELPRLALLEPGQESPDYVGAPARAIVSPIPARGPIR